MWLRFGCAIVCVLAGLSTAQAADRDRAEALREAFGCDYVTLRHKLSPAEREKLVQLGGRAEVTSATYFRPVCAEPQDKRAAYIVSGNVRTMPQTVLIAVRGDGTVDRVEVLSFHEPAEYKGRDRWYKAFVGRRLNNDLNVQRAIPLMAGATLTSRNTTQLVREVLALHTVLVDP